MTVYTANHFCYIDRQGKAHKPFVMPQKYPSFYDNFLKSYNAPELDKGPCHLPINNSSKILKLEGIIDNTFPCVIESEGYVGWSLDNSVEHWTVYLCHFA